MMQLESSNKMSTIGQRKYISTTTDWMLQLVLTDDKRKKAYSISKQSYKFKQEKRERQNEENDTNSSTKKARDIKEQPK